MLCRVSEDSRRGKRRLREAEVSASAVGGPAGRPRRLPPNPLSPDPKTSRAFLCSNVYTTSRAKRDHDTFATDIIPLSVCCTGRSNIADSAGRLAGLSRALHTGHGAEARSPPACAMPARTFAGILGLQAGRSVGRRDRLAGQLVPVACRRPGNVRFGTARRSRAGRPPRQPGGRFRHSYRGAPKSISVKKVVVFAFLVWQEQIV